MMLLRNRAWPLVLLSCASLSLVLTLPILAQSQATIPELHLTFTTIDVPGAGYTGVWGINSAGDMVGNYGQDTNGASHGFLYREDTFTFFDYPGQSETVPTGINDAGLIVGYAGDTTVVGFLYDGLTFTTIRHGSDSATFTAGLNNASEIVGGTGTVFATKGFLIREGKFKRLNVPGQYIYVYGNGINNLDQIVGWTDQGGFKCRAGACQTFTVPGATTTRALGVNDGGTIVGWYDMAPYTYAFASRNGRFISFRFPGALATAAAGINDAGQVVGQYTFDYKTFHGFVTSPIASSDFQSTNCWSVPIEGTEQ